MGNQAPQPTLHLSDDNTGSIVGNGKQKEEFTLSLDNFTAPALDRSINVEMQVSLLPGASTRGIIITGDNKKIIPISPTGHFTVTIPYQVVTTLKNPTPIAPIPPNG